MASLKNASVGPRDVSPAATPQTVSARREPAPSLNVDFPQATTGAAKATLPCFVSRISNVKHYARIDVEFYS
jgi:hypothetical protein